MLWRTQLYALFAFSFVVVGVIGQQCPDDTKPLQPLTAIRDTLSNFTSDIVHATLACRGNATDAHSCAGAGGKQRHHECGSLEEQVKALLRSNTSSESLFDVFYKRTPTCRHAVGVHQQHSQTDVSSSSSSLFSYYLRHVVPAVTHLSSHPAAPSPSNIAAALLLIRQRVLIGNDVAAAKWHANSSTYCQLAMQHSATSIRTLLTNGTQEAAVLTTVRQQLDKQLAASQLHSIPTDAHRRLTDAMLRLFTGIIAVTTDIEVAYILHLSTVKRACPSNLLDPGCAPTAPDPSPYLTRSCPTSS